MQFIRKLIKQKHILKTKKRSLRREYTLQRHILNQDDRRGWFIVIE